jgi:hypothetical protein
MLFRYIEKALHNQYKRKQEENVFSRINPKGKRRITPNGPE